MLPFKWKNLDVAYYFARLFSWGAMPIMGWRLQVGHEERLSGAQPCIYVGNHQSNFDCITMGGIYPRNTALIGKKELRWIPFFGWFFEAAGNVLIDRNNRSSAFENLETARKAIHNRKICVWMFPEGTRNRGKTDLLPFKKGAFHLAPLFSLIAFIPGLFWGWLYSRHHSLLGNASPTLLSASSVFVSLALRPLRRRARTFYFFLCFPSCVWLVV